MFETHVPSHLGHIADTCRSKCICGVYVFENKIANVLSRRGFKSNEMDVEYSYLNLVSLYGCEKLSDSYSDNVRKICRNRKFSKFVKLGDILQRNFVNASKIRDELIEHFERAYQKFSKIF